MVLNTCQLMDSSDVYGSIIRWLHLIIRMSSVSAKRYLFFFGQIILIRFSRSVKLGAERMQRRLKNRRDGEDYCRAISACPTASPSNS